MDSSGRISTPEQLAEIDKAHREALGLVPLPEKGEGDIARMNRHERRKWYAEQRAASKAIQRAAKTAPR